MLIGYSFNENYTSLYIYVNLSDTVVSVVRPFLPGTHTPTLFSEDTLCLFLESSINSVKVLRLYIKSLPAASQLRPEEGLHSGFLSELRE